MPCHLLLLAILQAQVLDPVSLHIIWFAQSEGIYILIVIGPLRHPRPMTAADLHLVLEKEQEAVVCFSYDIYLARC